jgi:hypothetical protein
MRRIASFILALMLSGCGYNAWWNPSFTGGYNPNLPASDSENMRRAQGQEPSIPPLTTEPGDIWPGPLAPAPTLKDLETTGNLTSQPEAPVPGSPLSRGISEPNPSPNPSAGSSTQPGSAQRGLATQPAVSWSSDASSPAAPSTHGPAGQVIQSPNGPAVTVAGEPGYQTTTTPAGGQSIIVPNGNGTSTVIHSDGRIETVQAPK